MPEEKYQLARMAMGLCRNCGKRKQKPGCTSCVVCLQRRAKTYLDLRAARRERGKCPECGRRRPVENRWGCARCLEQRRQIARRCRERVKKSIA